MQLSEVTKGLKKHVVKREEEVEGERILVIGFPAYRTAGGLEGSLEELVRERLKEAHHPLQWAAIEKEVKVEVKAYFVQVMDGYNVEVRVRRL